MEKEKKLKYPKGNPMKIIFGSELDYQSLIFLVKKEVFDDIDKRLVYCLTEQHKDTLFPMGGQKFRNEVLEVIRKNILQPLNSQSNENKKERKWNKNILIVGMKHY